MLASQKPLSSTTYKQSYCWCSWPAIRPHAELHCIRKGTASYRHLLQIKSACCIPVLMCECRCPWLL